MGKLVNLLGICVRKTTLKRPRANNIFNCHNNQITSLAVTITSATCTVYVGTGKDYSKDEPYHAPLDEEYILTRA